MIKINRWYFLLSLFVVVFYMINDSTTRENERIEKFIGDISEMNEQFIDFTNQITSNNLDTISFYAQYRVKAAEYFFFDIRGNNIGGAINFSPSENEKLIVKILNELHVHEVWKYPSDNFYQITLRGYERFKNKDVVVLLLKRGEDKFKFSANSSLKIGDTTSVMEDFSRQKSIFIINQRIWIKFLSLPGE